MLRLIPRTAINTTTLARRLVAAPGSTCRHHHRSLVVLADHDDDVDQQREYTTIRNRRRNIVGERPNSHDINTHIGSQSSKNYYASSIHPPRHFSNSQHAQQQQQTRWLATHSGNGGGGQNGSKGYYKHSAGRGKKEQDCPFVILGLSATPLHKPPTNGDGGGSDRGISYSTVKKTFLKIAMARHPDTSKSQTKQEQEVDKEIFLKSLHAFEKIAAGPNGVAVLRTELEGYQDEMDNENNDLNAWFKQETGGFDMPFMDARTIKEVAEMTATLGGGLDRDGGMWTLARMVTESAKSGNGDGMSILQLEAGSVRDRNINGILRRKRNR